VLNISPWKLRIRLASAAAALTAVVVTATTAYAHKSTLSDVYPLYALGSSTPSCVGSERAARMIQARAPEYPAIALEQGVSGQALIEIVLDSDGNLMGASVARTSGNHLLDQAALHAVKASRYAAGINDCSSVGGTFRVEVDFRL